jgi:hypothetical protein
MKGSGLGVYKTEHFVVLHGWGPSQAPRDPNQLGKLVVDLATMDESEHAPAGFVFLSDLLACIIVVASVILVWDGFRAWYGQRTKLSQVAGTNDAGELVIAPIHPSSFITFSIMIGVMLSSVKNSVSGRFGVGG